MSECIRCGSQVHSDERGTLIDNSGGDVCGVLGGNEPHTLSPDARYTARFTPQAWVNDYAIDVDPEGDQEWDCTEGMASMAADYRGALIDEINVKGQALDGFDWLRSDPNAPEWVREWQGPFSIWIRRTERTVRCPERDGQFDAGVGPIEGCGLVFTAAPDDDGLYDCPGCGMWFDPDHPNSQPQPGATP